MVDGNPHMACLDFFACPFSGGPSATHGCQHCIAAHAGGFAAPCPPKALCQGSTGSRPDTPAASPDRAGGKTVSAIPLPRRSGPSRRCTFRSSEPTGCPTSASICCRPARSSAGGAWSEHRGGGAPDSPRHRRSDRGRQDRDCRGNRPLHGTSRATEFHLHAFGMATEGAIQASSLAQRIGGIEKFIVAQLPSRNDY